MAEQQKLQAMLKEAVRLLSEHHATFAAVLPSGDSDGEESFQNIYVSDQKGIAPIMEKMDENRFFFKGAAAADRFLGKAAAMLLMDSGAACVYGEVISSHAQKVLDGLVQEETAAGGSFFYQNREVVPYIINRKKDGMCPMEKAVLPLTELSQAYPVLKETLAGMKNADDGLVL